METFNRSLGMAAALLGLFACGGATVGGREDGGATAGGSGTTAGASGGASSGGQTAGATSGGTSGGTSGASGGSSGNCAQGAQWIYVVDVANELSSFHPDTRTFQDIGKLACPAQSGATPFSMGVDRNAVAWVLYNSGEIFEVNTATASCSKTSFVTGQQGFQLFGMGFSADQTTAQANGTDTLYIAGGSGPSTSAAQFGSIAFPSLTVTKIGSVTAGWPELTGTGDGQLWGFFPSDIGTSSTPRLSQIDKSSGSDVSSFDLPTIKGSPAAWAMGFYGGAFWIFLQRNSDPATVVYEVQRSDGGIQTAVPNAQREIVGAGVSTCAPLTFE
ncbi:MAG: hypothetical protein ACYCWW_06110 [Deltaproteobacteria bacterium]